jgi:tetratricopeptide (TPR) repeat protein
MRSLATVGIVPRKRVLGWRAAGLGLLVAVLALGGAVRASEALARRRLFRDLTSGPYRTLEGRLSDARLDRHRPLRPAARGSGEGAEPLALPLGRLGALERAGDDHGLAVALLLGGEAVQARVRLERLSRERRDPGVNNDQAAAALAAGDASSALPLLDQVLDREPLHPQALFNRAVALRALDLPLTAARSFERVSALGEPGWSAEAAGAAQRLRTSYEQRAVAANRSREVRRALAREGRLPSAGEGLPDDLREGLYEATWCAPTRAAVERLLPLARRLDEHYGGGRLEAYVRRVVGVDFGQRGPVARQFAALERGRAAAHDENLVEEILRQRDQPAVADIVLGTLVRSHRANDQLPRFQRLVAELHDPWFEVQALQLRSDNAYQLRRSDEALRIAEEGLERCRDLGTSVRCVALRGRVVRALSDEYRVTEALGHLRQALAQARLEGWVDEEAELLELAGRIESFRPGGSLGRAYLEELFLHPRASCAVRSAGAERLAQMALRERRVWEAAGYLNQVPDCGRSGARAVFAAMTSIPDADADAFFARVGAAVISGSSPALALRDARSSWASKLNSRGNGWIDRVLVFE